MASKLKDKRISLNTVRSLYLSFTTFQTHLLSHWSLPFTFFSPSWHPACIYEHSLAALAPQPCTLRSAGHHWDPSCEPGGGGAGPVATPPSRLVLVTSPSVSEWRPLSGLVRRCPRPGSPCWSASYHIELWSLGSGSGSGNEARKLTKINKLTWLPAF